ncbi:MAG: hypothetical protein MUE85_00640 [Microscillaceae bacterium]|jgi:hypothetical protein|nr:hypothetical protein [Microscillaceae bacterium]
MISFDYLKIKMQIENNDRSGDSSMVGRESVRLISNRIHYFKSVISILAQIRKELQIFQINLSQKPKKIGF